MSTTRKSPNSPYQYIVVRRPDGTQVNVSTKTRNKSAAALMSHHVQLLLDAEQSGPLEMVQALDIAEVICKSANKKHAKPLPAITYLKGLLEEHTGSEIYRRIKTHVVNVFEVVLIESNRGRINIWDITGDDIGKFQAHFIADGRSANTIRMYTHALSALFTIAVKRDVLAENVVKSINKPPRPKNSPRRPFTDDELNKVFVIADNEWRGMMIVALYTGLRLGDISRLVYRDIDLSTRHIRAAIKKNGGFDPKPIPRVLMRYFLTLKMPKDLDTPLFPRAYRWAMTRCKQIGRIGSAFIDLLIRAGVRKPGASLLYCHREAGEKYAPLSFHCLRHNFSSMLKKKTVPEAIARKIVGHRSIAVSDMYTHLGEDVMLAAVQGVPTIVDVSSRVQPQVFEDRQSLLIEK